MVCCRYIAEQFVPIVFGLDRIHNLELTTRTFDPIPGIMPDTLFRSVIGLSESSGKEQEVILSFQPQQGDYVKSLPIHNSQEILIENENELRVRLNVVINFELRQAILMHGDLVKVIEPKSLVDEISTSLKRAFLQYEDLVRQSLA